MDSLPAPDAEHAMAERRPSLTYSRSALLALYDSTLLSATPDMSRMNEWYSDYADTPASPPSHPRPSPAAHASSAGSNKARPNPFANFGRFGVDGGLEGEKPEVGKRRDGAPHLGATANGVSLEGKSAAGRNVRQEGGAVEGKDRYGTSPTNGNMFERERERGDRMRARGPDTGALEPGSRSGATAAGTSARERREEVPKREGRAEEGGWRSVGGPDRERRLRQTNTRDSDRRETTSTSNNTREERGAARSGRPAWMEDESSAQPAWMDAPASGSNAGMFGSSASKADLGAAEGGDGVDGIQAWKAQMKEMERREREGPGSVSAEKARVEPVESVSVFSALAAAPKQDPTDFVIPGAKESRASVFDNLGLGTGIAASSSGGGEGGGRGSRFAKFFDGKPVAAPAPPAQRSAFEGLLGGMMGGGGGVQGGPEPSVQDRESMARLMGMLQVSGARTVSPSTSKSPAPTNEGSTPSSPPAASASTDSRSRQASTGGSRFAFSQPSSAQLPPPQSQVQRPPPPQQQGSQQGAPPALPPHLNGAPAPPPPHLQQLQQQHQQSFSPPPPHLRGISSNSLGSQQGLPSPLVNQSGFGGLAAAQSQAQAQAQAQSNYILAQQAQNGIAAHLLAQAQAQHLAPRGLPAGMTTRAMQQAEFNTLTQQQQQHHAMMGMNPSARPMQPQMYNPGYNGGPPFPSPDQLPPHLRGQQQLPPLQQHARGPPLPGSSAYPLPAGGRLPGPPPPQQQQQQPGQPQLNANFGPAPQMYMPYPPQQFQGRPPPPPSNGGGYGPGVPDLMSLLNAGGAGMRPPPQQQQQQQPQRPAQGQDMRGYMMEER